MVIHERERGGEGGIRLVSYDGHGRSITRAGVCEQNFPKNETYSWWLRKSFFFSCLVITEGPQPPRPLFEALVPSLENFYFHSSLMKIPVARVVCYAIQQRRVKETKNESKAEREGEIKL